MQQEAKILLQVLLIILVIIWLRSSINSKLFTKGYFNLAFIKTFFSKTARNLSFFISLNYDVTIIYSNV